MQLASRTQCGKCSCRPQLRVTAQALPSSNGYVPPSSPSLDRPAGGGSRSYDLPRSSDIVYSNWGPRSDLLRPSGGAARGTVFATVSSSEGSSIDRPGGRGGRADMPISSDIPTPQDPALARPGGRAGRDLGLESGSSQAPQDPALGRPGGRGGRDLGLESGSGGSAPQDPALGRPGGRGGRDLDLSSGGDVPTAPISLDRPGGRGGRDAAAGGGDGGDGGDGNNGGSGGGDGDSDSSENGGFNIAKGVGGLALYAGVIAAAWFGHKEFFAKPEALKKSCCGGSKGKADKVEAAPAKGKKK